MYYSDHLASAGEICLVLGQYAPKYMDWFFIISHPFMIATQQSDPPRHPPAMHDASFVKPHIPQVPKPPAAAPTHPCSHVDQPRHAMDVCHAITERLERLLNLRIVTAGTKTHEVMEECIRIARGVTEEGNVYVRSRRRRHTDQP
ncbi:hypothetical protein GmHk_18G050858 [Glycine max]|nr:hypothetical protein GmHk_18G050858 [Glycine max]